MFWVECKGCNGPNGMWHTICVQRVCTYVCQLVADGMSSGHPANGSALHQQMGGSAGLACARLYGRRRQKWLGVSLVFFNLCEILPVVDSSKGAMNEVQLTHRLLLPVVFACVQCGVWVG